MSSSSAGRHPAAGRHSRRDFLRRTAGVGALAAVGPAALSACGGSGGSGGGGGGGGREVVRFAFAPDPVWDFMNDNGIIVKFEEEHDMRIVTSSTWDEFAYFAGGHGDIVSTATYELPLLEQKTKTETVTFGRYNLLRITPIADPKKGYKTLADIPKGSKIGVPSAVSSTLVWGMFARKLHNLDFRVGGGDFELVVEDHFVMPEHVKRGELEAALAIPEAAIGFLRKGELEVMYDNKLPYQVYGDICSCQHQGVMGNNFTATKKWFDAHPEAAAGFLGLWEEGIKQWRAKQAQIIATYPQHFAVEDKADVTAMQGYLKQHDWFVPSVAFDDTWVKNETQLYDLMKETKFMPRNAPTPAFEPVKPAASAAA
jgi:ABC-type nitrate/sulfonate/bicarbonate transport system substrate-binding protein